jgi:FKBP-type peptidyl-prolyl cis-trans isomerase FkpA
MFLCKIALILYLATSKINNNEVFIKEFVNADKYILYCMKLDKNSKKASIKFVKIGMVVMCMALGFISCKKDDDTTPPVPPRDRGEQQILDKDSLIKYLESHYYNSADFVSNPNPGISNLVITKLNDSETQAPEGSTLLLDAVEIKEVKYSGTDYEFYVLVLNQGGGDDKPTFADNVRVIYEGSLLDGTIIDKNDQVPTDFDLIGDIGVEGWRRVLPLFNTAEFFNENEDGTVVFTNKGVGVMFLPSGLGYYANTQTKVPAYSPLIFKFELLQMFENDHDGDGIPSYLEDLNEDGVFTVNYENIKDPNDDDTDGDYNPDYVDADDDGDGIPTRDEIEITTVNKPTRQEVLATVLADNQVLLNKIKKEQNGTYTGTILTFPDTDGDGIPDYLDAN